MPKPTFIVADDHPLFREALSNAIEKCVPGARIVESDSLETLQSAVAEYPDADLLFLDLHMPGVQGFSALVYLRGQYEALPTVMVSASEDAATIRSAIDFGASGYIPKSSAMSTIREAITAVLNGDVWLPSGVHMTANDEATTAKFDESAELAAAIGALTPHQFRVLQMVAEGLMNKQIAYRLNVSEATIKAHVTAILRKLKVTNRTQAVVAMSQLNVDEPATTGQSDA